jgi:hypothetical protein
MQFLKLLAIRTQRENDAMLAIGFAGIAPAAAVPDEPMAEHGPEFSGHKQLQVHFNLLRFHFVRESEPLRQPHHVRIYDNPFVNTVGIPKDDIGRLAPNTWQLDQFLHRARDLAAVLLNELPATVLDAFRSSIFAFA